MSGYVFLAVAILIFALAGIGINYVIKVSEKTRDDENFYQ